MSITEIFSQHDAIGMAELVRNGEVSSTELVDESIRRIEAYNPTLNAVVHTMYDEARQIAEQALDGPFGGVPFLVKELLAEIKGSPLRNGSRFHQNYVSVDDSPIVSRYRKAGLIIVGRTNTPEYGITPYTESELYGPARNPWDTSRTPGGSSGGAGAAVAAQMVPAAHGGDGGGSIRIPASCCGLFGLKPTRKRTPDSTPYRPWQGWVNEHVLTRSVRDSAAMLDVTAGPAIGEADYPAAGDRSFLSAVGETTGRLRIAYTPDSILGNTLSEDAIEGLTHTVQLLKELGHELIEAKPAIDGVQFGKGFLTMLCGEIRADIEEAEQLMGRKATNADYEDSTWALGLLGQKISAVTFTRAMRDMQRMAHQVRQFSANFDLFLTPTLAEPAVKIGALQPSGSDATALSILGRLNASSILHKMGALDEAAAGVFDFTPVTPLFNVSGQPAMSVPLHWTTDGLPVGMHFAGQFGGERALFRLAAQLEEAQPWFSRTPALIG